MSISKGAFQNPTLGQWRRGRSSEYLSFMNERTHGPVATNIALWFTMLSPLIGLITAILSAWFFNPLSG